MNSTVHNMVFRFLKQLESPKKPTEKGIGPPTVIREPKKGPPDKPEGRRRVGACLFSRAASSQVSWAQVGLTAVFGMGTGVPPPPSTPTMGTPLARCSVWVSFRRLAPPVGLEPTTFRLTAERSTD